MLMETAMTSLKPGHKFEIPVDRDNIPGGQGVLPGRSEVKAGWRFNQIAGELSLGLKNRPGVKLSFAVLVSERVQSPLGNETRVLPKFIKHNA
jgi:hypothetical protein